MQYLRSPLNDLFLLFIQVWDLGRVHHASRQPVETLLHFSITNYPIALLWRIAIFESRSMVLCQKYKYNHSMYPIFWPLEHWRCIYQLKIQTKCLWNAYKNYNLSFTFFKIWLNILVQENLIFFILADRC